MCDVFFYSFGVVKFYFLSFCFIFCLFFLFIQEFSDSEATDLIPQFECPTCEVETQPGEICWNEKCSLCPMYSGGAEEAVKKEKEVSPSPKGKGKSPKGKGKGKGKKKAAVAVAVAEAEVAKKQEENGAGTDGEKKKEPEPDGACRV